MIVIMPKSSVLLIFRGALKGELFVYLSAEATQGQGISIQPGQCIGEFSAIDRLPVSALVLSPARRRSAVRSRRAPD